MRLCARYPFHCIAWPTDSAEQQCIWIRFSANQTAHVLQMLHVLLESEMDRHATWLVQVQLNVIGLLVRPAIKENVCHDDSDSETGRPVAQHALDVVQLEKRVRSCVAIVTIWPKRLASLRESGRGELPTCQTNVVQPSLHPHVKQCQLKCFSAEHRFSKRQ